ncbi:hypothetical protein KOI35_10365 [Actinoplanes bogorensis]|uniref:Uncharacterized protein n=1 Tax=Paractinoplanes bogorensis TaxID=1610840 RepID=A0ABS5YKF0_9ACTN|nr:hypothetical protein [Actinoplanes bogorensis]MBU2663892.1 hypothetical protein [Actinoplanes bogorensis]
MARPHEMVVTGSSESGAEEWSCHSCGRRVLLRWPPHHERVVLDPGDEGVVHVGGRVGGWLNARELRWLSDNGIAWA